MSGHPELKSCTGEKQDVALGKEPPLRFELDEEVFVQLYSQKSTGRGHIIELPEDEVILSLTTVVMDCMKLDFASL